MVIKGLRQKRNWSQEQLAEYSGLGLRTVQRIESGERLSFESLQCIAAALDIPVSDLIKELTMKKSSSEWKKRPLWVRWLFLGSTRVKMRRKEFFRAELFMIACGITFLAIAGLGFAGFWISTEKAVVMTAGAALQFLGAYFMSAIARVGDVYTVWPWLDSDSEQD